jgi:hypothetical protein
MVSVVAISPSYSTAASSGHVGDVKKSYRATVSLGTVAINSQRRPAPSQISTTAITQSCAVMASFPGSPYDGRHPSQATIFQVNPGMRYRPEG